MTAVPLYRIADDLSAVATELSENGGELTPELEAQLTALEGAFEAKVERVALYIRNLRAMANAAGEECKRLSELRGTRDAAANRLAQYLLDQMTVTGITKVETGLIRARIQKSPPAAKCGVEPQALPEAYQRVTISFNAHAALDAWRAGQDLPAGVTVEQGVHLRLS